MRGVCSVLAILLSAGDPHPDTHVAWGPAAYIRRAYVMCAAVCDWEARWREREREARRGTVGRRGE